MNQQGKATVRHVGETVLPYALSCKENAARCAGQAKAYLGPRASRAATQARQRYATEVVPRIEQARLAAGPATDAAVRRSAAAMAALRGDVTLDEIQRTARRRDRRARAGRAVRRAALLGLLAGGAVAAWKWWSAQNDPDWLVEPSPATEIPTEPEEQALG
ncbi:DUF5324 family protein [Streptomyces sp. DSM 44915]|uniref:DUF5324 family protein n=1 Tax=Streptomyces chisholmiae TaxID=3075540 RepID=A0ABU2JQ76_9ACTN|nr:DUF5324 family protein [Streptomyces sp. DSM 44915]MDT0267134.1 DUF5324 family protein [Streptomyces sp. DSM 44915]